MLTRYESSTSQQGHSVRPEEQRAHVSLFLSRSCLERLNAACCGHWRTTRPKFLVMIPDEIFWGLPIRSRFSELLRYPEIGWGMRHIYMDDLPRLQRGC